MGAPVSKSNGESEASGNGTTQKTARKILFRTLVTEPWKALITLAEDTRHENHRRPLSLTRCPCPQ